MRNIQKKVDKVNLGSPEVSRLIAEGVNALLAKLDKKWEVKYQLQ